MASPLQSRTVCQAHCMNFNPATPPMHGNTTCNLVKQINSSVFSKHSSCRQYSNFLPFRTFRLFDGWCWVWGSGFRLFDCGAALETSPASSYCRSSGSSTRQSSRLSRSTPPFIFKLKLDHSARTQVLMSPAGAGERLPTSRRPGPDAP